MNVIAQQPAAAADSSPARDEKLWKRALEIHRKSIVVDTHNDILSFMIDENYDIGVSSVGKYHTDHRAHEAGRTDAQSSFPFTSIAGTRPKAVRRAARST